MDAEIPPAVHRVWGYLDGKWRPISETFTTRVAASVWAGCLQLDSRIEEEDTD